MTQFKILTPRLMSGREFIECAKAADWAIDGRGDLASCPLDPSSDNAATIRKVLLMTGAGVEVSF